MIYLVAETVWQLVADDRGHDLRQGQRLHLHYGQSGGETGLYSLNPDPWQHHITDPDSVTVFFSCTVHIIKKVVSKLIISMLQSELNFF